MVSVCVFPQTILHRFLKQENTNRKLFHLAMSVSGWLLEIMETLNFMTRIFLFLNEKQIVFIINKADLKK